MREGRPEGGKVGERKGKRIILLKPQTFMNLSGNSVMSALQFYKLRTDSLVVVHDEIDLPLGAARLKNGGGHGESLTEHDQ